MLAESVIRIGRPIMQSNLSFQERIRLLTDVGSPNCKNYFQNVIVVELKGDDEPQVHIISVGNLGTGKAGFSVDERRNTAFPVCYPNGGNPLVVQGVYPLPCYLMWEPHIKSMEDKEEFFKKVLMPRINSTIGYMEMDLEKRERLGKKVAGALAGKADQIIKEEKQLGILMIFDLQLPVYEKSKREKKNKIDAPWIAQSIIDMEQDLYLNGEEVIKRLVKAKISEAATLGTRKNAVGTFSNQKHREVVSIYNKSWLWLSPTWESPTSIYWGKKDWVKGIKVDPENYEAFLYGSQFLKEIQVPVSSSVLKEMFAPITTVEAKKHMKATSFQPIFGIPMVLPLMDGDSRQNFKRYRRMLKNEGGLNQGDLHLEILAGLKGSIVPEFNDEYRLSILYYSGDLSRGDMHVRAVIEDVIPSIASKIQDILRLLTSQGLNEIQDIFNIERHPLYRTENLPSLLANAYGPGYVWDALQKVFHGKELGTERMYRATKQKLGELANKEAYWEMKQELVFHYCFLYFIKEYNEKIRGVQEGVRNVLEWSVLIERYSQGTLTESDFSSVEELGFISGLLLKQFSNSYYQKTKKDFVKNRVMKFGSKLDPVMVWKHGVLRCQELASQWDIKIAANFWTVLPYLLLGFLKAQDKGNLVAEKDVFMTAFWSGYLIYRQVKDDENLQEVECNENK